VLGCVSRDRGTGGDALVVRMGVDQKEPSGHEFSLFQSLRQMRGASVHTSGTGEER